MSSFPPSLLESTLKGRVDELMRPGKAREFIQPWYVPISTLPGNTGAAAGGIGSSFTVTPAGDTPALHAVPGLHVTAAEPGDIRLQNFFFCERPGASDSEPVIADFGAFMRKNHYFPLRQGSGSEDPPWVKEGFDAADAGGALARMLEHPRLFADNRERLERWHIALSRRTREAFAADAPRDRRHMRRANAWLVLDFYGGALRLPHGLRASLMASCAEHAPSGVAAYPAQHMEYQGLYPLAGTLYASPGRMLDLSRLQWSPMAPGDERLCALPVTLCRFTLENPGAFPVEATLLQTLENLCGFHVGKNRPGVQDAEFRLLKTPFCQENVAVKSALSDGRSLNGVLMRQMGGRESGDLRGAMAMLACADEASAWEISVKPAYYGTAENGVVREALDTGRLDAGFNHGIHSGREILNGAICATTTVAPGVRREIIFALCLDFPRIEMPGLSSRKRYELFFPDTPDRAADMAREGLESAETSLERIRGLHAEAAAAGEALFGREKKEGAARLATQLCNSLSFLPEATVWDTRDRFWVRECADYPFFNSLDVYFYGSFSLLQLLPGADAGVMREFARAVLAEDTTRRRHWEYTSLPHADLPDPKLEAPRALRGAVPHDLGSPFDARPDAYVWHNVKTWKDLAPKFVLLVLRSHRMSGDPGVLADCWEAVSESLRYLADMREPGQAIPLTRGTDDTFDNLSSHGISIYSGSLWAAGLKAAAEIARLLGREAEREEYAAMAAAAETELAAALWDEEQGYYHFFATPAAPSDFVPERAGELRARLDETGLAPGEDLPAAVNAFLNADGAWDENGAWQRLARDWAERSLPEALPFFAAEGKPGRRAMRARKKLALYALLPEAWTPDFRDKLLLDSDDSFCDQFLADTYLQLLGLEPLTPPDRRRRALERIVRVNWKVHGPEAGAANLTGPNGEALDPFQARDAWIGLQHSLAAALLAADLKQPARDLLDNTYRNLYEEARIPFAAPEGFTRIDGVLHYTAGRYFRPGMIWALPVLLDKLYADKLPG